MLLSDTYLKGKFMPQTEFSDSSRLVFKMSLPIFIELLLQLLVGNIDQIMISQYSQNSVAAIGNGNQVMGIIIMFLNVMSAATSILISRALGARDENRVTVVCNVSLIVIMAFGALATAVAVGLRGPLFSALDVPGEVIDEAKAYLAVVGAFIIVQGLYANLAAMLRSHGFVKDVMAVSVIMNVTNIVGNAILINGLFGAPRLGLVGAAISTDISKALGLLLIYRVFRRRVAVRLSPACLRPFPFDVLRQLLGIGLPSGAQEASYSLSELFILRFVNSFGTVVVATRVYCNILSQIEYVYVIALAQATQILVGYLVGGRQYDRVNNRIMKTTLISIGVSVGLTGVIYLFSDTFFSIFTQDPYILSLGKTIILIEFFLEVGRAINIVLMRTLVAAGDVVFPVVIGASCGWIIAVMGGYLLGVHLGFGLAGIWAAKAADELVRGAASIVRLKSNAWRKRLELHQPAA